MKWADLCITAVRYDPRHQHIDRVRARPDLGEQLGTQEEFTRAQVVEAIANGLNVITAYSKDGKWQRGAPVEVVVIDGVKYLRTDANRVKADNLGELPEF